MYSKSVDMNIWKSEQLEYFKRYIKSFRNNSKEYNLIKEGINELEKAV